MKTLDLWSFSYVGIHSGIHRIAANEKGRNMYDFFKVKGRAIKLHICLTKSPYFKILVRFKFRYLDILGAAVMLEFLGNVAMQQLRYEIVHMKYVRFSF